MKILGLESFSLYVRYTLYRHSPLYNIIQPRPPLSLFKSPCNPDPIGGSGPTLPAYNGRGLKPNHTYIPCDALLLSISMFDHQVLVLTGHKSGQILQLLVHSLPYLQRGQYNITGG